MDRARFLPVGLAAAGLLTVLVGIHTELLHARPMYEFTIDTRWGRSPGQPRLLHSLNHEERLLARLSGVGLVGAALATRWRQAAAIPALIGGIVLFYPIRAVLHHLGDPASGIYTGVLPIGDPAGRIVFGAEPYLLVLGGLLLVAAGVAGWRLSPAVRESGETDGTVAN
ncbi:hypothetical protein ACFQL1_08900 [Halomicroarcula sp. GCM10025709]|uniref:hypothetical protein n=1 Tax=Haloarcula TaxID=2237 RepID=UPI0024C33457|nr:hypothetical protein [Halomicroarcula sp. YJ-61-S]